jgi:anti-sigma B factor antagonist
VTDRRPARSSRSLKVDSTVRDTSLVVELAGDLDMAAAFRVESELDRLVETPGIDDVVLDLAEVKFLDSAGLGALLSIREQAKRLGRDVRVGRASEPVRRILDATATRSLLGG